MSLFVQSRIFHILRRYATIINTRKSDNLRLRITHNLNDEVSAVYCRSFSTDSDISISHKNVKNYLDSLVNEYKKMHASNSSEIDSSYLYSLKELLEEKSKVIQNLEAVQELATEDKEMKQLADQEQLIYKQQLEEIDEKLLESILENVDTSRCKSLILEVTPGVGGQEAMLFVKDLCNMYIGYLNYLRLDYEVIEMDNAMQGGTRKVSILIRGHTAFEKLKYEGGVHRVQRIPATDKSGRVHTSTATVAVLPEPTDIEINLNDKDLKIETKKSGGPGGQAVNTTDSAVRIVHLPTGIAVNCQVGRSQLQNKELALQKLRMLLYEQELNKQTTFSSELRKKQMGMGMRNEKIRTYNYNQDRITDHRLENGTLHDLEQFMKGGPELEKLAGELHRNAKTKMLLSIIENWKNNMK